MRRDTFQTPGLPTVRQQHRLESESPAWTEGALFTAQATHPPARAICKPKMHERRASCLSRQSHSKQEPPLRSTAGSIHERGP
jgi:hypothetical protein